MEMKAKEIEVRQTQVNVEEALRQRRDQYATCKNARGILPKSICDERLKEFKNEL
ncbi:hypothetical protein D3C86_1916200 [compost metagenome]